MIKLLASVGIAFSLMACSTSNPYTGEKKTSHAVKGTTIGAAAGAVLGLVAGKDAKSRRQYALIGAGVGAATGAGVGVYMDVQEAKLRQELEATGVSVIRDGDNIILSMPGNITFPSDSSSINEGAREILNSVSKVLKEYKKTNIAIAGYTDSTGNAAYNQLLSEKRAQTVANILMDFGVDRKRVFSQGFGIQNPIASNDTAEGRAQNRRVELALVPTGE
jgi:outer membrane protein OmpA-like peptidoglycan-associated protein